jgi:hypothetical protein
VKFIKLVNPPRLISDPQHNTQLSSLQSSIIQRWYIIPGAAEIARILNVRTSKEVRSIQRGRDSITVSVYPASGRRTQIKTCGKVVPSQVMQRIVGDRFSLIALLVASKSFGVKRHVQRQNRKRKQTTTLDP